MRNQVSVLGLFMGIVMDRACFRVQINTTRHGRQLILQMYGFSFSCPKPGHRRQEPRITNSQSGFKRCDSHLQLPNLTSNTPAKL